MTTRYGSLLKFAEGVTREEAIAALKTIKHLLELPEGGDWVRDEATNSAKWVARPVTGKDMVKEYNDEYGSPVWYIP